MTFVIIGIMAVVGTFAGYCGALIAIPFALMERQIANLVRGSKGVNRFVAGPPGKNPRIRIERANPDVQPAGCAYDLSNGPLRFSGPVWEGYWSLSFFQMNSDNFATVTNAQVGNRFDVLLALKSHPKAVLRADEIRIESPTMRGIAIIRMFVGTADDMRLANALVRQISCEQYA
jgi:uncharacterized membrane protein